MNKRYSVKISLYYHQLQNTVSQYDKKDVESIQIFNDDTCSIVIKETVVFVATGIISVSGIIYSIDDVDLIEFFYDDMSSIKMSCDDNLSITIDTGISFVMDELHSFHNTVLKR